MKILVAPAHFKESLSANEVADILGSKLSRAGHDVRKQIISDGGEGFLEPFIADGGEEVPCHVQDPIGRKIKSGYVIHSGRAIIEMAKASGLELVEPADRDIIRSSTYGTGELIRNAIEKGINEFIVSLGGSATNDGGMGMMRALDAHFLDQEGNEITTFHQSCQIDGLELTELFQTIRNKKFTGAVDVTNPLLGNTGATMVYGKQKGADDQQLALLEEAMNCYAGIVEERMGKGLSKEAGTGAAGGMGFAMHSFLNAPLRPGFEIIADIVNLQELVDWADIIITGEGRLDSQTSYGKAPARILDLGRRHTKPVIAVAGHAAHAVQFKRVYALTDLAPDKTSAMKDANMWLAETADVLINDLRTW